MLSDNLEIKDGSCFADQDRLIQDLLDIDKVCYGELSEKDTGPISYWNQVDPYSFYMIACIGARIVGYIDIEKFSDKGIEMLSKGLLREGEMLEYLDTSDSKSTNLYIGSIVVLPEFRKTGLADKLLKANIRHIKSKGYSIKGVYATIWTDNGERSFSEYNPQMIARDELGHRVLRMDAVGDI